MNLLKTFKNLFKGVSRAVVVPFKRPLQDLLKVFKRHSEGYDAAVIDHSAASSLANALVSDQVQIITTTLLPLALHIPRLYAMCPSSVSPQHCHAFHNVH